MDVQDQRDWVIPDRLFWAYVRSMRIPRDELSPEEFR